MNFRSITVPIVFVACTVGSSFAQVSPDEIRDRELKALEKTYLPQLRAANTEIAQLHLPFTFQLNRYVGLEPTQQAADTRGLEFVKFHDRIVLKVTGNYSAAYNAVLLTDNQRAGRVLEEVISPILGVVCRDVPISSDFSQLGFEISFHVRQREGTYDYEGKEILVLVLDRKDALSYLKSPSVGERQAILDRSEVYLNGKPYALALGERDPYPDGEGDKHRVIAAKAASARLNSMILAPKGNIKFESATPSDTVRPYIAAKVAVEPLEKLPPTREITQDSVKEMQNSYQSILDHLVEELESRAHFVRYAPPAFVPFHNGLYLQLSMITTLPPTAAGSQYRLTALAFDQHVAHIIRPVLGYFKDHSDFDGIDFSTTVRLVNGQGADGNPLAVEFIFPLKLMRAYAEFDTTGQQLIDASFVLINGERVSLSLQAAEAGSPAH